MLFDAKHELCILNTSSDEYCTGRALRTSKWCGTSSEVGAGPRETDRQEHSKTKQDASIPVVLVVSPSRGQLNAAEAEDFGSR